MAFANKKAFGLLAAGLMSCMPVRVVAQAGVAVSRAAATAAGQLLNRSPLGPVRNNTLPAEAFVAEAREVTHWQGIDTVEGATQALEFFASTYSVIAHVQSVPTNLRVQYRRTYANLNRTDPTVTTNNDEFLSIATYYAFRARNPYTGQTEEQIKNCLQGCTVKFVFCNQRKQ